MKNLFTLFLVLLNSIAIILIGVVLIHQQNRIVWKEQALDYNVQRPCDHAVQTCVLVGEIRK